MKFSITPTQLHRKKRSDGSIPIYIRFSYNRKSRYRSTGIAVEPSHWDTDKKRINPSHSRSEYINSFISATTRIAREIKQNLSVKGNLSLSSLLDQLPPLKNDKSLTFQTAIYRIYVKENKKPTTFKKTRIMLDNFDDFLKESGDPGGFYSGLANNFQYYLSNTLNNSNATVNKKMELFRAMTNWLINNEVIYVEPFRGFTYLKESLKLPQDKNLSYLDWNKVTAMKELDLKDGQPIWHARNYFLYSVYNCGLDFSNLARLTWGILSIIGLYTATNPREEIIANNYLHPLTYWTFIKRKITRWAVYFQF